MIYCKIEYIVLFYNFTGEGSRRPPEEKNIFILVPIFNMQRFHIGKRNEKRSVKLFLASAWQKNFKKVFYF